MLNSLEGTNFLKGLHLYYNTRVFSGLPSANAEASGDGCEVAITEALLAIRLADDDRDAGMCFLVSFEMF